ncbi:hypothetical protein [Reichenbachiella agariperforans]|uniref:hypothetical protein n=1 Tax=Reichenbachiella agariperforans TaxID=156994 RepID=UPI001C0805EC|nr:hypothetical protein [Reichenbachiella agariperforans]MBU2916189.1 hypothetical protein [Reichenbachiella agariperforans]
MKTTHIYTIILLVLVGLIVYQSLVNQDSFRQAQSLSQSLKVQIDTLQSIAAQYERIHQNYETIHAQLLLSQHRISDMNQDLTRISDEQQQDVIQIRDSLRQVLRTYDAVSPNMMSHHQIPSP